MLFKIIVGIIFFTILYCLGSAAFYLTKRKGGVSFAKALTWRIALSIFLFVFLFFALLMGWISPHGVN